MSFLYATHRHDQFYITVKYHGYIPNGFQVMERTWNCIWNHQGDITQKVGWLVVLGLNGPLRQYFSLYFWLVALSLTALWDSISVYIGPSPKEREKEKRNDRREKKCPNNLPPAPTASVVGPCPTVIQISRTTRHWKFTQHHRTTRPPPISVYIGPFPREREWEKRNDRREKKCPNNPHRHLLQAQ